MNRKNTFVTTALATAIGLLVGGSATATEPCGDFGECKVLVEINSSDGDIGFHFLMDGDDLRRGILFNPDHKKIFAYTTRRELGEQYLTETFAESAEPLCFDPTLDDDDENDDARAFELWILRANSSVGAAGSAENHAVADKEDKLATIRSPYVREIRGKGLLNAVGELLDEGAARYGEPFRAALRRAAVVVNGTQALIAVPGGTSHDVWSAGNFAPRLMQTAADTDFELEVKFESPVTSAYQMEGLLVEQDADNFIRLDFYSNGSATRAFAAVFVNGQFLNGAQPLSAFEPLIAAAKNES